MKIIDMHCDTLERLWSLEREGKAVSLESNSFQVDFRRMKSAGYVLQNFAIWVDCGKYNQPMEAYREMGAVFRRHMSACSRLAAPVRSSREMDAVWKAGRIAGMLTVEDGGILEGQLERLYELWEDGVRMMTLTWNYNNELGTAAAKAAEGDAGLTELGKQCVCQMEELSILVDVSHLSDQGIRDVLDVSKKPFVASHSNARALCPMARNLPDELLRKMGERGCVVGLNFFVPFLLPAPPWLRKNHASMEKYCTKEQILHAAAEHAKHLLDVCGSEGVGLGSDLDGITKNPALPGCEALPLLYDVLRRHKIAPSQIDRIFSGNVKRLYEQMLP